MKNLQQLLFASCTLALLTSGMIAHANPLKVMLISGQNNHNWRKSTPFLKRILDDAAHLKVDVVLSPTNNSPASEWAKWRPQFSAYDCVVLDYNGDRWPEEVSSAFVKYIRDGGSAVAIHAANNSFSGWKEFEQMIGMLWRGSDYGDSLYFDKEGTIVREKAGEGRGMGHGGQYDWLMTTRDASNPITQGMPLHWQHAKDELYHGQRGPAQDMHILLSAYSDPKNGGTGKDEPIVWWVPCGKGKVLTNVMGHVGETTPVECVGFQVVLLRSIEWLATGTCATPLPDNFPTEQKTQRKVPKA
jgi:hypothetical protein